MSNASTCSVPWSTPSTIPVIASTGTNDTAHSVLMTQRAKAVGVDGILAVTPYYNRPSPTGLSAHFRAIAEASDLPVLLYDIPVRSGRRIGPQLTLELARDVPTIVGVKDATGDVAVGRHRGGGEPGRVRCLLRRRLPDPAVRVDRRGRCDQRGRPLGRPTVRRAHRQSPVRRRAAGRPDQPAPGRVLPVPVTDEYPNPVPAKAACRALGLDVGQCRLPNAPAPAALDEEAKAVIAHVNQRTRCTSRLPDRTGPAAWAPSIGPQRQPGS